MRMGCQTTDVAWNVSVLAIETYGKVREALKPRQIAGAITSNAVCLLSFLYRTKVLLHVLPSRCHCVVFRESHLALVMRFPEIFFYNVKGATENIFQTLK